MKQLDENLWLLTYPNKVLGMNLMRNVSVMRLPSARLIIHSTAPFSEQDVLDIKAVGQPAWLVDAMLRHDTFAQEAIGAFPAVPYLAPPGFSEEINNFPTRPIVPPPSEWQGEVEVVQLGGLPSMRETVFFHRSSRTLIVADLAMNFPHESSIWQKLALKVAVTGEHRPGISRALSAAIKDRDAFESSIAEVLSWDFDRMIVGHGEPIETGAREKLRHALSDAGLLRQTASAQPHGRLA